MATLQDTVKAVLAELQKLGTNLQETDIVESENVGEITLLLGFKADGTFVRISPTVLREATTKYLTKEEYKHLVDTNMVQDGIEYNIYENE